MEGYSKYQFGDILFNDITRKHKHFVNNDLTFVVDYSSFRVIAAPVFNKCKGYENVQTMHV